MSAPIVLILAAGQGTRMRSKLPKVLHEVCGTPMVLWPVRAALDAGVERVVVVDSPQRALEGVLPAGTPVAQCFPVQREPLSLSFEDMSPERIDAYDNVANALHATPGVYRKTYRDKRPSSDK